jgi:hypothetical protein
MTKASKLSFGGKPASKHMIEALAVIHTLEAHLLRDIVQKEEREALAGELVRIAATLHEAAARRHAPAEPSDLLPMTEPSITGIMPEFVRHTAEAHLQSIIFKPWPPKGKGK